MLREVLKSLALWGAAAGSGLALASALYRAGVSDGALLAAAVQAWFLVSSLALSRAVIPPGERGLSPDPRGVGEALAASAPAALALALASPGCEPPVSGDPVIAALVALVLAPLGEEALFRGLLEGYLLSRGAGTGISVALPAALFSLVHLLPYSRSPPPCAASVMVGALVLGLLAGWLRARRGSLAPAVAVHFCFNLVGTLSWLLRG